MEEKKNDLEVHDHLEQISAEEVNEIMAKYDRESAVRIFAGNKALIIKIMLIAFTVFAVAINTVIQFNAQVHRSTFIALVLFLAYILYPAKKDAPKNTNKVPWYDIVLAIVSAASFLYTGINFEQLVAQAGNYTSIDIAVAMVAIVLLFEACRRVVGIPILVVVGLFILYAYFGASIPGYFGHRGFGFERIATHLYFTTEGIIGTPLAVCSTFIFLFILFGAFLERTGIGQFFIDIANSIAGKATGGPAKVAVISSALQGTITGSSVANTVGSVSFTIPMMKRMGYRPEFAAAVEAAASTGG
ncbi:MAG: TRAP transporter large permease subunit, partial [Peptococcaceae bacterium]|nr:TRAP transporter large permease subunit [Peptococcaceae bacterium]